MQAMTLSHKTYRTPSQHSRWQDLHRPLQVVATIRSLRHNIYCVRLVYLPHSDVQAAQQALERLVRVYAAPDMQALTEQ